MSKVNSAWKTAAIIIGIILILETGFIWWAIDEGTELIEQENQCSITICEQWDTYYYDDITKTCYCFVDYSEEIYTYQF